MVLVIQCILFTQSNYTYWLEYKFQCKKNRSTCKQGHVSKQFIDMLTNETMKITFFP